MFSLSHCYVDMLNLPIGCALESFVGSSDFVHKFKFLSEDQKKKEKEKSSWEVCEPGELY